MNNNKLTEHKNEAITNEVIDSIDLDEYVQSWKQGREIVQQLSAEGIFQIANHLGLSITECEITLSEDNKTYKGCAIATNVNTGQTMFGHAEIPLFYSGNRPNPNAYELTSTNAQRNALKKFIPHKQLGSKLKDFKDVESPRVGQERVSQEMPTVQEATPLETIKAEARAILREAMPKLNQLGLTISQVFEEAQNRQGPNEQWDYTTWNKFKTAVQNLDKSWISSLAQNTTSDEPSTEESKKDTTEPTEPEKQESATPSVPQSDKEPEQTSETESEVSATETDPIQEIRTRVYNLFVSCKEALSDLGITEERFWRFGVSNRYEVKKSDDLTLTDWQHLEKSLLLPGFAEWIQGLAPEQKQQEPEKPVSEPVPEAASESTVNEEEPVSQDAPF